MFKDSLVAINIINNENDKKELLNKTNFPILYYWDGENSLTESIKNDVDFKQYCLSICNNLDIYLNSKIHYFYFKFKDDTDDYTEFDELPLTDIIKLDEFNDNSIYINYLIYLFKRLYFNAYKTEYNTELNNIDIIEDIYKQIKNKFSTRISKTTIINWVRSRLTKKNIDIYNTNIIIDNLTNILNKYD